MTDGVIRQKFWVVDKDYRVVRRELTRTPPTKGAWWDAEDGLTLSEGHHCFAKKKEAKAKAREDLPFQIKRAKKRVKRLKKSLKRAL